MSETVRFAGAQIPVTPFIKRNVETLKTAINWAANNNVDYLVTPEAALSGYSVDFDINDKLLESALLEIEMYAASKNVGICLGTLWQEAYGNERVKRNQIRYYSKDGRLSGITNKTVLTPLDISLGIVRSYELAGILLPIKDKFIPVGGIICADLYGVHTHNGGLPPQFYIIGAKLLIHATNADRGTDANKDEIEDYWIEGNIRRVSHQLMPVISADNCYMMDGTEYHGRTATQSGVCINGQWAVSVPRTGIHYFYHDFLLDEISVSEQPSI